MWEFALLIGCLILGGIILLSIIIVFPLMIYAVPYELWVERQQQYNIPKDIPSKKMPQGKKMFFNAANATKLYISWITKKPHGITKF